MKVTFAALLAIPALAAAFTAVSQPRVAFMTKLEAARSKEEDLELTRQVIASFMDGKGGVVEDSKPTPAPAPAPAPSTEQAASKEE